MNFGNSVSIMSVLNRYLHLSNLLGFRLAQMKYNYGVLRHHCVLQPPRL